MGTRTDRMREAALESEVGQITGRPMSQSPGVPMTKATEGEILSGGPEGKSRRQVAWLLIVAGALALMVGAGVLHSRWWPLGVILLVGSLVAFVAATVLHKRPRPEAEIIICPSPNCGYRGPASLAKRDTSRDYGFVVAGASNRRFLVCPVCGVQVREV
jgi:hypothetical protein